LTEPDRSQAADSPAEGQDPVAGAQSPLAGDQGPLAGPQSDLAGAQNDIVAGPVALEAGVPAPKKQGTDWWGEIKAIFWLVLAVLTFHSLVAKPFYIPSESMMPGLLVGDRLVVTKYPYGWSWVSPSFHVLPHMEGRLWGALPERGDVVIVTPPGASSDYIKRVIGLPGDTIQVIGGVVWLNGHALPRQEMPLTRIPIDPNTPCGTDGHPDGFGNFARREADGLYCEMPVFRETIPTVSGGTRSYDTIDVGDSQGDNFALVTVPEGHVFLMGDNRDHSADSRFPLAEQGLGGPVPWENLGGRAEFITFSLDGSSSYWNPISWFTALRGGRAGTSLHAERGPPLPPQAPPPAAR
jgi:signal peptidase I